MATPEKCPVCLIHTLAPGEKFCSDRCFFRDDPSAQEDEQDDRERFGRR